MDGGRGGGGLYEFSMVILIHKEKSIILLNFYVIESTINQTYYFETVINIQIYYSSAEYSCKRFSFSLLLNVFKKADCLIVVGIAFHISGP